MKTYYGESPQNCYEKRLVKKYIYFLYPSLSLKLISMSVVVEKKLD